MDRKTTDNVVRMYSRFLQLNRLIDEVAFFGTLFKDGEQFNSARDNVRTWPIETNYDILYRFFRVHDRNYRVEMMQFLLGHSPVHLFHDAMKPVHASYKTADMDDYMDQLDYLADRGWFCALQCESDYGAFSYWKHRELGDGTYLKPRVNLRD